MATPALVPCLGPSAGLYYPELLRPNGCRIQTDEKSSSVRSRRLPGARPSRSSPAGGCGVRRSGNDGRVHVGRDLGGACARVVDADLVDEAAEELAADAVAADPQRPGARDQRGRAPAGVATSAPSTYSRSVAPSQVIARCVHVAQAERRPGRRRRRSALGEHVRGRARRRRCWRTARRRARRVVSFMTTERQLVERRRLHPRLERHAAASGRARSRSATVTQSLVPSNDSALPKRPSATRVRAGDRAVVAVPIVSVAGRARTASSKP